jgi:hypothetical protein
MAAEASSAAVGCVTVAEVVAVQLLPSVTVTVKVPAASASAVFRGDTTAPVVGQSTRAATCRQIDGAC